MIPEHLKPFFWDVNAETFDPEAYPAHTIGRILEFGNEEAVRWLKATFSEDQIKEVIRTDQRLSPRSASFWALVYHIPPQDIAALK